jgi:hypothetical protein
MTSFPGASHAFLTSRLTSPPEETLNERLVQYATYAGKAAQVSLRKQFANAVSFALIFWWSFWLLRLFWLKAVEAKEMA